MDYIIQNEPNITGIVKDTNDNFILIENENGEYEVSLEVENKGSMTHFNVGDEVVVYYDGNIAESYPMQINTVYAITLLTPVDRIENADNEGSPDLDSSVSDTGDIESTISDKPDLGMNASVDETLKSVLLGDSRFCYLSDGKIGTITIADVPSLFDANDPSMKIWQFAVVDLNRDGEDEVILFVVGAAGDAGGKVILHKIDGTVYGYITDNRTLVDLKTDGTFNYSDPTGVIEAGIAVITDFSETGYMVDKISYATGTYEGWNSFVVDYQPATEEEYQNAVSEQDKKQNAEWYDFNSEN